MTSRVVGKGQCCRSAGEHDQGQGGLGAVEPIGSAGPRADLVIEAFMAPVRQLPLHRRGDASFVLSDRGGGLDELGDAAALGP